MQPRRYKGVVWEVAERQWSFAVAFVVMFGLTFATLAAADLLPNPPAESAAATTPAAQVQPAPTAPAKVAAAVQPADPSLPTRIVISKIGIDATVANPTSTNVDVLDQALLSGAARYPTSAQLGVDGTLLIFGHSSYLPVVHNQAYKTFDGIQNLQKGDIISVYAGSVEYRYSVLGVRMANADEDVIELPQTGRHLTLVTCDSFASKSHRFVVTADLVAQ